MKNTVFAVALLVATTVSCGGSQQQVNAGVDVCAVALSTVPFVAEEASRLGLQAIDFARQGCLTGVLIGQTVEALLAQARTARALPCPAPAAEGLASPWAAAGSPAQ
jgi:hypothetical protein